MTVFSGVLTAGPVSLDLTSKFGGACSRPTIKLSDMNASW